jgi:hypothetical protein
MKPLAANNVVNVLFFPLVLLIILSLLSLSGVIFQLIEAAFVFFVFVILLAWIVFGLRDTYNVFYDSEFIYLNGVFDKHKLSLGTIRRVAVDKQGMRVVGVTTWKYLIEFDETIKVAPQTVFEPAGTTNVQDFVKVARMVNPALLFEG